MSHANASNERSFRVLVLAPTGRDAEVLVSTLDRVGVTAEPTEDMQALIAEMNQAAGAAVIASEALAADRGAGLNRWLEDQPEWSDLPIILMDSSTHRGDDRSWLAERMIAVPHAVILVRPVHTHTLVSTLRSALRSRERQYEVRNELAERRRAEASLRELNAQKDEFLAMLGHELRNPLAAIVNATELLEMSNDLHDGEDKQLEQIHAILARQSGHMARLIDGLLEISRIARGKIDMDFETLDLRQLVTEVLHDRESEVQGSGLELKRECPSEPVWVKADRVRLEQVIGNVLGNAFKFTEAPGAVRLTVSVENGHALLRVSDTGIGMRPEMLRRVFQPFVQDSRDLARSNGGLGIGLALTKSLVEQHEGTIEARSDGPGEGSEFLIRLPSASAPAPEREARPPSSVTPHRILVVEDNEDAGRSLTDLLNLLGHESALVETGAEALAFLRENDVDIVLCDIGLPGMSGFELARAIRDDRALRSAVLIALTGYGQPDDRRRTAEAGFDDHLTKPVNVPTLNRTLERVRPAVENRPT